MKVLKIIISSLLFIGWIAFSILMIIDSFTNNKGYIEYWMSGEIFFGIGWACSLMFFADDIDDYIRRIRNENKHRYR